MEDRNTNEFDQGLEGEVEMEPFGRGKKIWDSWDIPDGRVIRPSRRRKIMRHERIHKTAMILDPYEYAVMDRRDTILSRRVLEQELEERTFEATIRRQRMLQSIAKTAHRESEKVVKTKQTREARKHASEYRAMEDKLKVKVHHTTHILEAAGIGSEQSDAAYVHTLHTNGAIESYALTRPIPEPKWERKEREREREGEKEKEGEGEGEVEQVPSEIDIELKPKYISSPSYTFMYIKYAPAKHPELRALTLRRLTPVQQRPSAKTLEKHLDKRYAAHVLSISDIARAVRSSLVMHALLCASNRRRIQLAEASRTNRIESRCKWALLIHRGHINDIRGTASYMVHKAWRGHFRMVENEVTEIENLKTRLRIRDVGQNMRTNYYERVASLKKLKNGARRTSALRCKTVLNKMHSYLANCADAEAMDEIQKRAERSVEAIHQETRALLARIDSDIIKLQKIYKEKQIFSHSIKNYETD